MPADIRGRFDRRSGPAARLPGGAPPVPASGAPPTMVPAQDDSLLDALVFGQKRDGGGEGYWAPHTAPIDWCERNYAVSPFVAEFHNAWTNLAYVVVGLCILWRCGWRQNGPFIALMATSTVLTGVTSLAFHATLQWIHQKLDEVFENGILVYILHYHTSPVGVATAHFAVVAALILMVTSFNFCELHLVSVILLSIAKFASMSRQHPELQHYVAKAAAATLAGFGCWLADRLMCTAVSTWEASVLGVPVSAELHALWHLFTALALFFGMEGLARHDAKARQGEAKAL